MIAALLPALLLPIAASTGVTDPADAIGATGARLKLRAACTAARCDATLSWGPCVANGFELSCDLADQVTFEDVGADAALDHEVTGLEPGTHYRVRACVTEADAPGAAPVCGADRDFVTPADTAAPASPRVEAASIARAGALSHAAGSHQGRDVGAAVELGGQLLWFFGDTALTVTASDGRNWRTSTAAHGPTGPFTGDYPALDDAAAPSEHLDGNGAPAQFVPYGAGQPELVGDDHYFHWPIHGFTRVVDGEEEALIYFSRGVFFGEAPSATYVDVLRGGVSTTGAADRVMMWDGAGAGGDRYFPIDVEEDGFRYFACGKRNNGGFTSRLFLARVAPDQATDPAAFRYWNPASATWQPEQLSPACTPDACPVEGVIEMSPFADYHTSISWNPYLEQYLLVAGNGGGATLHVADALTGPWSAGTDLPATTDGAYGFLVSTATEGLPNYHAREAVPLRSADGRTVVLSYLHATPEGAKNRAIKLLRLSLERAPEADDGGGDGDGGPGDDPDDPAATGDLSSCGCGAGGGGGPAGLVLLALLVMYGRAHESSRLRGGPAPRPRRL